MRFVSCATTTIYFKNIQCHQIFNISSIFKYSQQLQFCNESVTMESQSYYLVEERVKTFKNWPFSDKNKCNIRNMAEAGFYSVATGNEDADAAKCFLCGKELDGWEASDDPWAEHKSHAAKCAFVQIGKNEDELLLSEFLSIVKQFMINEIKRMGEVAKDKVDEKAKTVRRRCLSRK